MLVVTSKNLCNSGVRQNFLMRMRYDLFIEVTLCVTGKQYK